MDYMDQVRNFLFQVHSKTFLFRKLDTWIETLEKDGVKDDKSEDDEDGILKTLANISRCLKRPLSDIQLEWTFMNITITSNWTSKQDKHKGENLKYFECLFCEMVYTRLINLLQLFTSITSYFYKFNYLLLGCYCHKMDLAMYKE